MIQQILFFAHYALLLLFGLILSSAFTGIQFTKYTFKQLAIIYVFLGLIQILFFFWLGESSVWKLYPLITHFPLLILLCTIYHRKSSIAIVAIASAYMCCQPAKWFGLVALNLTNSIIIQLIVQIITLIICSIIFLFCFAPTMSKIYAKDTNTLLFFGTIPVMYYCFDYIVSIYTDFWKQYSQIVSEFLPLFLCIIYMMFSLIYYYEVEKKTDAERKEQIIRIAVEQQSKEIEQMRKSSFEIKLLRHDMRHLLNNLALSIQQDDKDTSLKMIAEYVKEVDSSALKRYSENDIINYVISNYAQKCKEDKIQFIPVIEINRFEHDEVLFSSVLSNALDNAVNAVKALPIEKREIRLMMKHSNEKLLLSVRNPLSAAPVFSNQIPIAEKEGHGYGTQSIQYMTERLGGKVQFLVQDYWFVVRIVI